MQLFPMRNTLPPVWILVSFLCLLFPFGLSAQNVDELDGRWRYREIRSRGESTLAEGVFLFNQGNFVQIGFYQGSNKTAQAHAGSYLVRDQELILDANLQIVVDPSGYSSSHFEEDRTFECMFRLEHGLLTISFPSQVDHILERAPLKVPSQLTGGYRVREHTGAKGSLPLDGIYMFAGDRFAYVDVSRNDQGRIHSFVTGYGSFPEIEVVFETKAATDCFSHGRLPRNAAAVCAASEARPTLMGRQRLEGQTRKRMTGAQTKTGRRIIR